MKRMAKKVEKGTSSRGKGRGSTPEKVKTKGKESAEEATKPTKKPEGPRLQVGAPMKACWTDLLILVHFWDEGLIATEYARGTLHPSILKSGVGLDAVEAAEKRVSDMEVEVKQLRSLNAALRDIEQWCQAPRREAEKS
ncbi:hypothetical protein BHM03_00017733 [Ensete ventricosum]|nr:hypothetical protein BHM03_00017733 [Ensete ventricosum]